MKKYLEDLAYKACAGREMRTTLDQTPAWVLRDAELEKFAELVATHEREECAKLCHDEADDGTEGLWDVCCFSLAKKIMARGEA